MVTEKKLCGICGRFQPCKTGTPKGGKCQEDSEGPIYNRLTEDLPFNEFCWIPILDEPETITKKLLEIDDETGRIHAYIETYAGVINGHRYERYRDWDVDWCERDSCYYAHESGDCPLPLEGPSAGYTRIPLGVNFDLDEIATDEEETYWCALCKDELPRDTPCEHGDPDDEEHLTMHFKQLNDLEDEGTPK